ncbi:hypothetical protein ACA910_005871 [Epithemia clementina (nom. ined.)]
MNAVVWTVLRLSWAICGASAFKSFPPRSYSPRFPSPTTASSFLALSADESQVVQQTAPSMIEVSLSKPLGIILEEVEEGSASGVFVKEVTDSGSAAVYANQILGAKLSSVQGQDVNRFTFDAAMDTIIDAPEIVELVFTTRSEEKKGLTEYRVGDVVSIIAQQEGKEDIKINAKVGDNLRRTLLENGFEVYKGMKQTIGNCGGGGQCTFCAVDFLESDGWEERSDYEENKLARFPGARLSCLNNIQGPVTVRKTQR